MANLYIFNQDDKLAAILSNEAEETCRFWSAPFKEAINQGSSFEFYAQGNHEDAVLLKLENQVAFMDKDDVFRLFIIKEQEQLNGENGPQIHCICEPAMNELGDEIIKQARIQDSTLKDAMKKILADTRWGVGEIAELGVQSIHFEHINVLQAIEENIKQWGGELRERIEIRNNEIVGRYIDISARRGRDTGKIWEMDKDIISISHKVQSFPKTALYGLGAQSEEDSQRKITFANVKWEIAKGDPADKPLGQEWIGDPQALSAYGRPNADGSIRHRYGIYENGELNDPELLLKETWEALQHEKHPAHHYELDVFILEKITGLEHEKVRLGDTTIAIDRTFSSPIEVEERVIAYEYDVAEPDISGKVELGQFIDLYSDVDKIEHLEAKITESHNKINHASKPISDNRIENIVPDKTEKVMASGGHKTILLEWAFIGKIHLAYYEVYASQIKGFTPDSSNLAFRGKTGMYTHKADSNEQWYFRVRAVNTHGVPGAFSEEVMAQTARIVSEDILFGPEIAAELRELSKTADLLANQSIDLEKIKQEALNTIQDDARRYTDEEIRNTENTILGDLNSRIENVNEHISTLNSGIDNIDFTLRSTADELRQRVTDAESELFTTGGQLTIVEQNIDSINGSLSTTISNLSNLNGIISEQQASITAIAGQISAKAEKNEVYTKIEADNRIVTAVNSAKAEIKLTTDGISQTVESISGEIKGIEIGGRNLIKDSNDFTKFSKNVGATYTAEPNISVSEWGAKDATKIIIRGGTSSIKLTKEIITPSINNQSYVLSVWVKNIGSYPLVISPNTLGTSKIIEVGFSGRVIVPVKGNGTNNFQINISTTIDNINSPLEFIAWRMKGEQGTKVSDWTPAIEDTLGEISDVRSYASSIEQKADSISHSVTSLDQTLTGRISMAESTILQQATQITAKVDKDGVIAAINIQPGTVKIDAKLIDLKGDVYITNGQAKISNLVVTNAALANASISRSKLQDAIIGNAQIENLAVTGAKIANATIDDAKISSLSANKLLAGTIDTSRINIYGGNTVEYTEINGAHLGIYGQFSRTFANGSATYNAFVDSYGGTFRAGITSKRVGSTNYANVFRWTALTDKGLTTQRAVHSGSTDYNGARFIDFYADETLSSDVQGLGMHVYSGQSLLIEANFGLDLKHSMDYMTNLTSGGLRVNANNTGLVLKRTTRYDTNQGQSIQFKSWDDTTMAIIDQPNNNYNLHMYTKFGDYIILGARQEVHIKDNEGNNWRNVVASGYKRNDGYSAYINGTGTGNTKGAGDVSGTNEDNVPVLIASAMRIRNADTNMYLAVASNGEVYVTDLYGRGGSPIGYRPIRASAFNQQSSRQYKTNIEHLDSIGLETINSLTIVSYDLKMDIENNIFNPQVGLISEDSASVATIDGKGIDLYKLSSFNTKAIQELSEEVNWLKIENQYLKQKINNLESRFDAV